MCVCRRSELSLEEFHDYWLNHHGPLLQKFASSYKVYRYVQSHTIDTALNKAVCDSRGMLSSEYDGVAELWWKSEAEFLEAINSEEGQKLRTIFLDAEAKFLDFSKSTAFFTKEHIIVE
ncbi:EthD domain-containing protein [Malaciobacter molluscorum]|nr:EthD domain-containing protein [Malaciobacter molluscorum]